MVTGCRLDKNNTNGNGANHFDNVTCPFCGILCDDLKIGLDDQQQLEVLENGCPKSVQGFTRTVPPANPQIDGKDVSLDEAVAEVARLIRGSHLPIFGGLGTDINGMRAVMAAADKAGGVVDHAMSDSQYRNYRVLQTSGWIMTTLTEARNRADVFVIVGTDIKKYHPRFFERIVCNEQSMFSDAPPKRTIIFLGDGLEHNKEDLKGSRIGDVITIPAAMDKIGEIMVAMRAMAKGQPVNGDAIGGVPRMAIEDLLKRCKESSYGVMAWSTSALDFDDADLTVHALCELVKDFNQEGRFAGLPLGGSEGSGSAAAVSAWQSGFPMRVSYASGKPIYDGERFSTSHLLNSGEADLLIWIASFTGEIAPPETDVPVVLLGTPAFTPDKTPKVYIPVGTPGVDHAGALTRCDSSVTMPVHKLKQSTLPSVSHVIEAIESAF